MKASPYFFDCSSTCLKYKVRIEQKEEKEKKRIDKEKKRIDKEKKRIDKEKKI